MKTQLSPKEELSEGVEDYKSGRYVEAVQHFQRAVDLDPEYTQARLYLATALAQCVIRGLGTKENLDRAQRSVELFQEILDENPRGY